jgi:uncharacterized membrane protein
MDALAISTPGALHVQEIYSGPLPHPSLLKDFGKVDPSFPERIMQMTEANNAASVKLVHKMADAKFLHPLLGQIFSFAMFLTGFAAAIFFALKGIETGIIIAIAAGFSPILIAAISNLKPKQD